MYSLNTGRGLPVITYIHPPLYNLCALIHSKESRRINFYTAVLVIRYPKYMLLICTGLVSLNPDSDAIIRPTKKITREKKGEKIVIKKRQKKHKMKKRQKKRQKQQNKEKCPTSICILKRETKNTLYIQCDKCDQWFHQWCLHISKKKAETEPYICKDCYRAM